MKQINDLMPLATLENLREFCQDYDFTISIKTKKTKKPLFKGVFKDYYFNRFQFCAKKVLRLCYVFNIFRNFAA